MFLTFLIEHLRLKSKPYNKVHCNSLGGLGESLVKLNKKYVLCANITISTKWFKIFLWESYVPKFFNLICRFRESKNPYKTVF